MCLGIALTANTHVVSDIFVDNIHMELSLWDTAGQEEFDRLRSLSYDDTQAIMLCFSVCPLTVLPPGCNNVLPYFSASRATLIRELPQKVDNRDSLENVGSKWVAEITEHCQGVKVVLVALKCDLREEHEKDDDGADDGTEGASKQIIHYEEGLEVARKIGALRYLGT